MHKSLRLFLLGFILVLLQSCSTDETVENETLLKLMEFLESVEPRVELDESTIPAAPDYSNTSHWAALPDRKDNADVVPEGASPDIQATAEADVFYLLPTSYFGVDSWNQPLDHEASNKFTDERILNNQVSVFNGCCRIYTPRYRQATFYASFSTGVNSYNAYEIAYADIKAAFEYYLEHYDQGRPIVIAAHSQGSRHALRLLEEYFNDYPELLNRLVVTYVIGTIIPQDVFARGLTNIPACELPEQTGCLVSWNIVGPESPTDHFYERFSFYDGLYESNREKAFVCVNPLSWANHTDKVEATENKGGVLFPDGLYTKANIDVGLADAQCKDGLLMITPPSLERFSRYRASLLGVNNFHLYDYNYFYMNLREDAQRRVGVFINH